MSKMRCSITRPPTARPAASSPAAASRRIGVFSLERTGGALVMSPARRTDNPPMMASDFIGYLRADPARIVAATRVIRLGFDEQRLELRHVEQPSHDVLSHRRRGSHRAMDLDEVVATAQAFCYFRSEDQ